MSSAVSATDSSSKATDPWSGCHWLPASWITGLGLTARACRCKSDWCGGVTRALNEAVGNGTLEVLREFPLSHGGTGENNRGFAVGRYLVGGGRRGAKGRERMRQSNQLRG